MYFFSYKINFGFRFSKSFRWKVHSSLLGSDVSFELFSLNLNCFLFVFSLPPYLPPSLRPSLPPPPHVVFPLILSPFSSSASSASSSSPSPSPSSLFAFYLIRISYRIVRIIFLELRTSPKQAQNNNTQQRNERIFSPAWTRPQSFFLQKKSSFQVEFTSEVVPGGVTNDAS